MRFALLPLVVLLFVLAGCNDDEIIVQPPIEENQAPKIVAHGPDFSPGGFETEDGREIELWVVVADANGLDDISAVIFSAESVFVNRVLIRPAAFECEYCGPHPSYVANDTLAISSVIPEVLPGVERIPMIQTHEGMYFTPDFACPGRRSYNDHPFSMFPEFAEVSDALSTNLPHYDASGPCIDVLAAHPPLVAATEEVFFTHVDIEYRGVRATVYDSAGESATVEFPAMRVV